MPFTYSDTLATNADKVRFHLGDTVQDTGPRPDGRNFSDNEIAYFLSEESDKWEAAVAHGFEVLQSEWTQYALSEREGDVSMSATQVADKYGKLAEQWRARSDTARLRKPTFEVY